MNPQVTTAREMHNNLNKGDDHDKCGDRAQYRDRPYGSDENDEQHNAGNCQKAVAM